MPKKEEGSRCSDERQPKHQFYILWLICFYQNGLIARFSWSFTPQREVKTRVHFSYKTNSLVVVVFHRHMIVIWPHQSYPEGWNQDTKDKLFCQIKKVTIFSMVYFSFTLYCNTVIPFIYQHCQPEMYNILGSWNHIS